MGGIKNKQSNKLSNKTLFKLDSRLPSFFQPSEMLTRNIPNTRKSTRWSLYTSKTIGSLRLVASTKYLSIACLSLALISAIGLNLYRTYSSSNIESNAIDSNSEVSTLANDSSSISLSFSNATGSCSDTSNPANVCMSIPDGGGIATGGHTVTVATSTKVDSYSLSLSSTTDSTSLVNDDSNATIPTISSSYPTSQELSNNSWGYSIGTTSSTPPTSYSSLKPVSNPDYLLDSTLSTPEKVNESINVIYGVMVKNPVALRAGNYALALQYTATATIPAPQIASVNPNSYELGSNSNNRITIRGQNLDSAYKVYLEGPLDSTGSPSATSKQYDCTNLMGIVDDSYNYQLACNIPTDQTNPDLEPGDYTIHVVTQGGEATIGFAYTEKPKPVGTVCTNADSQSACQVDIDANMIPIRYDGNNSDGSARWLTVSNDEISNGKGIWYNYEEKQWANAVTVEADKLSTYQNKSGVEVNNDDVLGYWVYIPRYAYRVQRRDASNSAVSAQNFDIVFETKDTPKKTPAACSGNYLSCSNSTYPNTTSQDDPLNSQTGWATHPAFTWGTEELNGFWIGKFETTGSIKDPTVLPNQYHKASEYIGVFYDIAKSIGQPDPVANQYGNGTATTPNAHNLAILSSHMLKNSEWGAVAYLASSKYGAGIASDGSSNVKNNASNDNSTGSDDGDGKDSASITGCGPYDINGSTTTYNCSGDITHQYQSDIGQLASTTNNEYGVYDMAAGAYEYVMGNYSTNLSQSGGSTTYMKTAVKPPYVDIYNITSNNSCTWNTDGSGCGGHALFETAGWSGDSSYFVHSSNPWFERGGSWIDGARVGVFNSADYSGLRSYGGGFRVALSLDSGRTVNSL